jgi:hypothetical protein
MGSAHAYDHLINLFFLRKLDEAKKRSKKLKTSGDVQGR